MVGDPRDQAGANRRVVEDSRDEIDPQQIDESQRLHRADHDPEARAVDEQAHERASDEPGDQRRRRIEDPAPVTALHGDLDAPEEQGEPDGEADELNDDLAGGQEPVALLGLGAHDVASPFTGVLAVRGRAPKRSRAITIRARTPSVHPIFFPSPKPRGSYLIGTSTSPRQSGRGSPRAAARRRTAARSARAAAGAAGRRSGACSSTPCR